MRVREECHPVATWGDKILFGSVLKPEKVFREAQVEEAGRWNLNSVQAGGVPCPGLYLIVLYDSSGCAPLPLEGGKLLQVVFILFLIN